eukprot:jgi/Psemu1/46739/gm1.46739_g
MVNGNPLKSNDVRDPLQTPWFGPDNIPIPRNGGNGYSEDMRKHTLLVRYGELGRLINNIESLPAARTARRYEYLAFLWRSYGSYLPDPQLYSLKNVSEAENAIGVNRKKGLTTANQAFTFWNLYKRFRYWTMDYPFGIADIRRDDMIDVDEAGIKLEHANKKMGKCSLCGRVRQRGNYGHGVNHTLKMAIAGNQEGRRWVQFDTAGTDVFSFTAFIDSILEDLPPGIDGNRKCFIMDNLLAHHNPLTLDAIVDAGHKFVFRAPYYPVDGPIEYVFNTIEMALSYQMYEISNIGNL